jgi:hypothetical protein
MSRPRERRRPFPPLGERPELECNAIRVRVASTLEDHLAKIGVTGSSRASRSTRHRRECAFISARALLPSHRPAALGVSAFANDDRA